MNDMDVLTNEILLQTECLIKECGEIMLNAARLLNNKSNIKAKSGDADFVTVFDEAVQKKLIEGLLTIFPNAHFFAEEKDNDAEDTQNGLCFIIDPIDGTTNFIHNYRASTVSVALLKDGTPIFGAVYNPYSGDYFHAVKDCGSFLNGEGIHVSENPLSLSLISFGTTPYKKKDFAENSFSAACEIFKHCADIRRSGTAALDMAYVACGRLDAFFEFRLCPWDYAAGYLLVKEAGGKVGNFDGGEVSFSVSSQLLCSNGIIHEELIQLINQYKI